jgi:DNA invertase Pin-like site-specific DNA recombinase
MMPYQNNFHGRLKMIVGYARTSTKEQEAGFEGQLRDLKKAGCERIYSEQVSALNQRDELKSALEYVREGDVLVVTKLDRLARSVPDLCRIVSDLERRKVGLRIVGMDLDTTTPIGRLAVHIFGAIAQFEREIMLERQREGIAKAKADGKYKGPPKKAMAKSAHVLALLADGETFESAAEHVGISLRSAYRIAAEAKKRVETI